MKIRFLKAFLLCSLTLCLLLVSSCSAGIKEFELSVIVLESEDLTVLSENPVKVSYGESASFKISLNEGADVSDILVNGKSVKRSEVYENGVLTLQNITAPTTVRITTGKSGKWLTHSILQYPLHASTEITQSVKTLSGSELTLNASPAAGAVFLGWSYDKPKNLGGSVFSTQEQVTVNLSKNTKIFANYDATNVEAPKKNEEKIHKVEKSQKTDKSDKPSGPSVTRNVLVDIIYDANGGALADGSEKYTTDFCLDYHEMPNSLPENNMFVRNGYVLAGYNTKPDGSGEYIGMGHKFAAEAQTAVVLYCMWQKETAKESFSYTVDAESSSVTIEKYNGADQRVYIPKYIDTLPVTNIAKDAFKNSAVTYVYIPSTVKTVGENAFGNCSRLSEITFFDSMSVMNNACFAGTPVKTVNLHAATLPKYPDSDLSFAKKYERFANHADGKRLIIVSGSSKHFGFDSDYAQELLGYEYNVVNYGNNAQMNVVFFLEALSNLANKDDVILFCPEQYGPFCYTVNGNPEMTALTFQGCESCYNLISHVDVREYTKFFDCYTQYSAQRRNMREKSYESRSYQIDEYGDCSISRKNYNSEKYRNGANGTFYFKADTIPADFAKNVNRILGIAQSRGVGTYLGYPPYNKNACDPNTLNDAGYDSYNTDMKKVISATLISDVRDYVMEGKYFYNTDYHLMEEGAKLHTEQVVFDFLAAVN